MKRLNEPITVQTQKGWPVRLERGASTIRVHDVIRVWVYQTRWWTDEERREHFRLMTDVGVFDIYRCADRWVLARTVD